MSESFAVIRVLPEGECHCFDPECIMPAKFRASVLDGKGKVAMRTDGCLEHFGENVAELYGEYQKVKYTEQLKVERVGLLPGSQDAVAAEEYLEDID